MTREGPDDLSTFASRGSAMTSAFDPLIDRPPARYVVGIDLGTTNSAVAYVDTQESPWQIRVLMIPQLVAPGVVEARDTLPSFHYEAAAGETADGALRLPWDQADPTTAVGVFARDHGGRNPGRLITSAKSWLCHAGVDRTADLLPWHGASNVERLSPIEVSARILRHVRAAWDARFSAAPLAEQDIVLTLPASFDEIARELTVEAAARADLPRVVLLEEPQAAFYAWVYKHTHDWHSLVEPGQTILVCDIGGGTSDFTLIRARASRADEPQSASAGESSGPQERIQFHRIAVGNHLILGGDNLDLALARHLEQKLAGGDKLPSAQWDRAGADLPAGQGRAARRPGRGTLDGESAWLRVATDQRRAAGGSHSRRSPRTAGRGIPASRDAE